MAGEESVERRQRWADVGFGERANFRERFHALE
jgi:hypothetical protein